MASIHILKVNKKIGLSPGAFTKKLARLRDAQAKRNKAISLTRRAKKRRLQLKVKKVISFDFYFPFRNKCYTCTIRSLILHFYFRKHSAAETETREGDSYKSEMVFYNTDTCITYIPEPTTKPAPQPATFSQNTPAVYFDLEKTGLMWFLKQSA